MAIIDSFFIAVLQISILILELYIWVLIIGAVLSWLIAFDVVNLGNRLVEGIHRFCTKVTEPALRPFRKFIPVISGLDLSPVALIFALIFLQVFLRNVMVSAL